MVKTIHISCAVITIILFSYRGFLMLRESSLLQNRILKILPHCVDAVLLATGIALIIKYIDYLGSHPWLIIKLLLVIFYIICGSIALKYGKTKRTRLYALVSSWIMLLVIVSLALTRSATLGF